MALAAAPAAPSPLAAASLAAYFAASAAPARLGRKLGFISECVEVGKKRTQKMEKRELIVTWAGYPGLDATVFKPTPAYPNLEETLPHGTCGLVGDAGVLGMLDGACPVASAWSAL